MSAHFRYLCRRQPHLWSLFSFTVRCISFIFTRALHLAATRPDSTTHLRNLFHCPPFFHNFFLPHGALLRIATTMPANTMPAPFRPSLSVTSPTMRAFGGLPNEIAMRIINLIGHRTHATRLPLVQVLTRPSRQLSRARDLKNLSETCQDLRRLARARLYEHIYVTETKWPLSRIFEFTRPSNPALKEVLDITFIRTGPHHDLFLNWDLLLNGIPWHQLRSIRVTGWSCQDEPSYFVDRVLANQRNLSTFDVRWPRLRGSQFFCWPVYRDCIPTFLPAGQLTSLTMSIGCETFPANPFSTAAFLTGIVTLKYLSAQFCVSTVFPTDTMEELEQYGFRLRLESLTLSCCTHSRDTIHVNTLHDFLDSIVDFSELQTLTLRNIPGAMHVVAWVGLSQRNNPQLRDLFIEEFSRPLLGLDRIGTLHSLERLVLTGRTNEHELQRLTDAIRRNHLQIRTLCLDISSRRRHGAPWPMSSLLIDDWSQLRHLLPHLPLLEELWISFPIIRSNSPKTAEKDMRNLLVSSTPTPQTIMGPLFWTQHNRK